MKIFSMRSGYMAYLFVGIFSLFALFLSISAADATASQRVMFAQWLEELFSVEKQLLQDIKPEYLVALPEFGSIDTLRAEPNLAWKSSEKLPIYLGEVKQPIWVRFNLDFEAFFQ